MTPVLLRTENLRVAAVACILQTQFLDEVVAGKITGFSDAEAVCRKAYYLCESGSSDPEKDFPYAYGKIQKVLRRAVPPFLQIWRDHNEQALRRHFVTLSQRLEDLKVPAESFLVQDAVWEERPPAVRNTKLELRGQLDRVIGIPARTTSATLSPAVSVPHALGKVEVKQAKTLVFSSEQFGRFAALELPVVSVDFYRGSFPPFSELQAELEGVLKLCSELQTSHE